MIASGKEFPLQEAQTPLYIYKGIKGSGGGQYKGRNYIRNQNVCIISEQRKQREIIEIIENTTYVSREITSPYNMQTSFLIPCMQVNNNHNEEQDKHTRHTP